MRLNDAQLAAHKERAEISIGIMFDQMGMDETLAVLADQAGNRAKRMDDQANRVMIEIDGVRKRVFGDDR